MNSNENINNRLDGLGNANSKPYSIPDDDEDIKLDYVSDVRKKPATQNKRVAPQNTSSSNVPSGTRVFNTVKSDAKAKTKSAGSVNSAKAPAKKSSKKSDTLLASLTAFFGKARKSISEKIALLTEKKKANNENPAPKATNTTTDEKKTPKKNRKRQKNSGVLGGVARFIIYIVFVAAASAVCSYIIISVANDMFAFSKDDTVISIEIPENATTKDVTKILSKNEIISNPTVFKFYTNYKKGKSKYYTEGYKSGTFELSPSMNYDDLIYALSNNIGSREVVRLTFPEGSTVDEIIDILIEGGVQNTREEYIDVIQNFDYDYRFINELDTENFKNGRKYRLEGYLFPDTYDFYTDASAVDVINKFLVNFNNKFDSTFYDAAKSHGLTVDEIINIASLVEKEARKREDFTGVSSVFHNRLKNRANFPYLQSDATIQYAFPERKSKITPEDLKYDSPYNTYIYSGLPPSAIANPGLDAIIAALYPDDTSYYYFISNNVGVTYFAKTLPEHNANVERVRKESES